MDYSQVVKGLTEKNISISSAESLTGGLFAATISSVPGVSKIYKGSVITYQNEVKVNVLGIPQEIVDRHGVVSKEVAYLMAQNVSSLLKTDMAVSFTGNAGPTSMEGKEVGLVYIGLTYSHKTTTYEFHFQGERNEIRNQCVEEAFRLIYEKLLSLK